MAEDHNPSPQNPQNQQQEEKEKKEEEEEEEEEESSSQSPPSKVARVSSDPGAVTMAVASPLGLGLGLGLGGGGGDEALTKTTGFTFMQMQEYHHQDLIFKHMVAGVPVPVHLILPIWKSVAASYGPHHYPSFAGLGNLCYDFRNSMEPEPGRCRRTDGKKWRCSRDVVPQQKYCEKHLHRGRNRSRKPVEGAGTTATATATTAASTDPSNTAVDDDGLAISNNNNGVSNNSTSSGSNVNSSGNDVTIARIGSSPISVLSSSSSSSSSCKTGAS